MPQHLAILKDLRVAREVLEEFIKNIGIIRTTISPSRVAVSVLPVENINPAVQKSKY